MRGPEEEKFCWTAETAMAVRDWWLDATPDRRNEFLQAVDSGQLDIAALPLNQTPTLNRREWEKMLHWLPKDLWQRIKPQSAIQNDVTGMPRAGAVALLDRGVRLMFFGINSESGGPPQKRPSAFWWKMPDGRRMFVWLGDAYPDGYSYFEPNSWRPARCRRRPTLAIGRRGRRKFCLRTTPGCAKPTGICWNALPSSKPTGIRTKLF